MMTTRKYCALVQLRVALSALALAAAFLTLSPRAPAATFTYTNPSCSSFSVSGTPPTQTVTCVSSSGGAAVPVCAPTANPTAPLVGSQTVISGNCSNQPTSFAWTGGACAGQITATCTVTKNRAGTVAYTVKATNATGTGVAAPISVTWK